MADPGPLIEPLIPALRRFAFALVRDHAAADDLVQDTLERALRHWSSRRDDGDLRAWLFAILRNLHVGSHRQATRRGQTVTIDGVDLPEEGGQEAAAEVHDVLAAVDQLPEEQKSLLLLVGVEDFSYDEAARILGLPVGTVMSRLSRARKRLRSIVEGGRVTLLRRVK